MTVNTVWDPELEPGTIKTVVEGRRSSKSMVLIPQGIMPMLISWSDSDRLLTPEKRDPFCNVLCVILKMIL